MSSIKNFEQWFDDNQYATTHRTFRQALRDAYLAGDTYRVLKAREEAARIATETMDTVKEFQAELIKPRVIITPVDESGFVVTLHPFGETFQATGPTLKKALIALAKEDELDATVFPLK